MFACLFGVFLMEIKTEIEYLITCCYRNSTYFINSNILWDVEISYYGFNFYRKSTERILKILNCKWPAPRISSLSKTVLKITCLLKIRPQLQRTPMRQNHGTKQILVPLKCHSLKNKDIKTMNMRSGMSNCLKILINCI